MRLKAFELKDAIIRLLEENAGGRYTVNNPQNRKSDAHNIFNRPTVTVYYAEGNFDKSKSSVNSPYHHDPVFNIHILAGGKSKVNLDVLQNPAATDSQLAEALSNATNASMEVDAKIDDLLSVLYDIIMSPQNRNLGTDGNTNRWIDKISKGTPEPIGAIVTETATITLQAQCSETVTGEIGTPGIYGVNTILDLGDGLPK